MLKIFAGRASLIGDTVMFLPVLNYLELTYPDSYKVFPISKKTSHSAPLFLNHPLIDKIYIMEEGETITLKDENVIKTCDIRIAPFPQHPEGEPCIGSFWWNDYSCCEETFRMAGFGVDKYRAMPELLKKPKLEKWFNIDDYKNTITIWPFAGYGGQKTRNPSIEWWNKMLLLISKEFGCNIIHLGHDSEPYLGQGVSGYTKMTYLPFFEQVKLALGCGVSLGTDSGSGWIMGAYGHPQITLLAIHEPSHIRNFHAFAPENYLNNNIVLSAAKTCNNINHLDVLNSIKTLYA